MIDHMVNSIAREIGDAVLAAAKREGRTKTWISEATGIPYVTLNRKTAGKSEFSLSELLLVAEALNTTPAEFTPSVFVPSADRLAS